MNSPLFPKPAATLIVWSESENPQVLMLKRQSGFFANAHAFPGGVVDQIDLDWASKQNTGFLETISCWLDNKHSPTEALAFFLAAIRETAEESGLLFATDAAGNFPTPFVVEAVLEAMDTGEPFYRALSRHHLTPYIQGLTPISWWITPEIEKKRYNTRFFLTPMIIGQKLRINQDEASLGTFMRPSQALKEYFLGEIILAPPTLAVLEALEQVASLENLTRIFKKPNQPICPEVSIDDNGKLFLILPGDPLYSQNSELSLPKRTRFEINAQGRFC